MEPSVEDGGVSRYPETRQRDIPSLGVDRVRSDQLAFAAAAIGARSIRSTRPPASLLRSAGMCGTSLLGIMNELVLFYEQVIMNQFSFRLSVN